MYTNKENSTKLIRISPSVKKRLEIFQAGDTPNLCIDRMITFFEITGYNPRYASKNPTALVEKRIEDLVKIVKSQERDIFKPIDFNLLFHQILRNHRRNSAVQLHICCRILNQQGFWPDKQGKYKGDLRYVTVFVVLWLDSF